jgi:large subunit ribosomal protein L4
MVSCVVKDWQGEVVRQAEVDLPIAKPETAQHLLYQAVRRQMTNARQGNAHTKTRSEVRGGGKKPWRQKGTGRARAGSIRSPLWPKGGVIFGPRKREFNLDMNRKERRLALRTAFQSRADQMIVVEEFSQYLIEPKTRYVAQAFSRWGVGSEQKALLIVAEKNENVFRATRNLARVKLITVNGLNVFDLLHADWIVITEAALQKVQDWLGKTGSGSGVSPVSDSSETRTSEFSAPETTLSPEGE